MMKLIRNAFILINFIALCCAAPWERYEADIRTVYNIDLLQSPQEAASNICGELDYECRAGAMKTYQNQKLMFVEEVHKEYSAHKNESGSIATVLYSSFIIDKITLPSTVCMFGDVHIQFVLYVLMYCKHCGIIVGNQSHAVSRWPLYMHLFPHANVQLFFGTTTSLKPTVSIIYTNTSFYLQKEKTIKDLSIVMWYISLPI
jgi:hypothetical protein